LNKEYIAALQDAIRHTHGCKSRHVETVAVTEGFKGKIAWRGEVEVFDLIGHPQARQGYAWGFKDDAGRWQYVAVLKTPPVDSPLKAVQAYIVAQHK
jgi:hypothetical protein